MTGLRRCHAVRAAGALMAVALLAAAGCSATGAAPGGVPGGVPGHRSAASSGPSADHTSGFGWFVPRAVPTGWRQAGLPDLTAVMAYPPSARPIQADPGAVAVAQRGAQGDFLLYLNATPRQGAESLANWATFRLAHQADEASSVSLVAAATGLMFTRGRGSCVMDDYTSRHGPQAYREIACFVAGKRGSSVLVAATSREHWSAERATVQAAVESYTPR